MFIFGDGRRHRENQQPKMVFVGHVRAVEKARMKAHAEHGMSVRAIARRMSRSRTAVLRAIKPSMGPNGPGRGKSGTKLSAVARRAIIRKARTGNYTARQIVEFYKLPV